MEAKVLSLQASLLLLAVTAVLDVGLQDVCAVELSSEAQYTILLSYVCALIGICLTSGEPASQLVPRTV